MAEKKEATNEEYADLITHHNEGKTKKPEPAKIADIEVELNCDLDKIEISLPPKMKGQTWNEWITELGNEIGEKVSEQVELILAKPEPEHEPEDDKEIGKLHEILYQACLAYIAAWKECKKCMIELNQHRPIVPDPEEDKRYLEHMPALEHADAAFLQASDELQAKMKKASEVFEDETMFVRTLVDAHRKHAEELHENIPPHQA